MKLVPILLVACALALASSEQPPQLMVLCGRQVASALAMVCQDEEISRGIFNPLPVPDHQDDQPDASVRAHVVKRSIFDDCCLKPCNTDVLISYC